jgi:hypothetical protein
MESSGRLGLGRNEHDIERRRATTDPTGGSWASGVHAQPDDERAALAARIHYRTQPMTPIEPDDGVAAQLAPGELVFAYRDWATVERRQPVPGDPVADGVAGCLVVTSRRIALIGRLIMSFDLDDVAETVLGRTHVLVTMRDGTGFALATTGPRLLRVEIAAARTAV